MGKYAFFTPEEDKVIQEHVGLNCHNLKQAFRMAAKKLDRGPNDIRRRYYRKRADWPPLFTMIDDKKNIAHINTKNIDSFGKFRADILTTHNKITLSSKTIVYSYDKGITIS